MDSPRSSGSWRALSARHGRFASPLPFALAALSVVWAINFLVVLPIVSPAFAHLVPYAVSLASKLCFGLAAAEVLRRQGASDFRFRRLAPAAAADHAGVRD